MDWSCNLINQDKSFRLVADNYHEFVLKCSYEFGVKPDLVYVKDSFSNKILKQYEKIPLKSKIDIILEKNNDWVDFYVYAEDRKDLEKKKNNILDALKNNNSHIELELELFASVLEESLGNLEKRLDDLINEEEDRFPRFRTTSLLQLYSFMTYLAKA